MSKRRRPVNDFHFEYLDHTADIQIHSWGDTLSNAFEHAALGMYNCLTPLSGLDSTKQSIEIEAEGHDLESLLRCFLEECLYLFHSELIVCTEVHILELDKEGFTIRAQGKGQKFDPAKHESGTEVKAITYSAMKIVETPTESEVFVIVDI